MTSLIAPIIGKADTNISKDSNPNTPLCPSKNILRSKENTCKYGCKKALKNKLKKYKLRQDGKEDQDIIEVSENLISSLFIKSPNKVEKSSELELEILQPKNYLFKMAKRKQPPLIATKSSKVTESKALPVNETMQESPIPEEKKQTNAFQVMMESRNKILGSNSPGKEKSMDGTEMQEIIEKRNTKAKRNLMLQQMAEAKGSLKKKEIEEQQEKYVRKKMEKRAEKLKVMLLNNESKIVKENKLKNQTSEKACRPLDSVNPDKNKTIDNPVKTLQLVSIFNETVDKISPEKKTLLKEDEEFLKKLSPSLRKKESMLSYFRKVQKESDNALEDCENDNVVIKVKLKSKLKKRGRKKKLKLGRDLPISCDIPENGIDTINIDVIDFKGKDTQQCGNLSKKDIDCRKKEQKCEVNTTDGLGKAPLVTTALNPNDSNKPRRAIKRPVNYNDDICLSSSDEELYIFTPKKKRHSEHKNKITCITKTSNGLNSGGSYNIDEVKPKSMKKSVSEECNKITKASNKEKKIVKNVIQTNPVKLAPIFTKAQPDSAAIEAKQKFLQSGVPEQLKKLMSKQIDSNTVSVSFVKVIHIQQLNMTSMLPSSEIILDDLKLDKDFEIDCTKYEDELFRKILNLSPSHIIPSTQHKNSVNTHIVLQNLKATYPRFPVYRTYRLLRGKKKGEIKPSNICSRLDNSVEILNSSIEIHTDNPDQLAWSEKYKPLSGNEIIGNFENINELRKWLVTWTENETKSKTSKTNESDSSDYYQSDPDSRDSLKSNNNLLVLSGPVGSGKTSSVYAIAAELSIKVIEVNASSKRTGKIMLQDLQEATQSHKVNRGTGSAENSQKSQEHNEPAVNIIKVKKRGRPKKVVEQATPNNSQTVSQESTRTAMSLILVDDADIVFDQDDGFCSAIVQLVHSSKRPVILITRSLSCVHLQRFLSGKILKMQPLLPNMLGTWLDIMCLADSGTCWPGAGAKFLNFFNGDMRKTMNCLQFYVSNQEHVSCMDENSTHSQNNNSIKTFAEDENSSMSWADRDISDDRYLITGEIDFQWLWTTFTNGQLHMKYPFEILKFWWSVPKLLNIPDPLCNPEKQTKHVNENKIESIRLLKSMCDVLDLTSVCDYFSHMKPKTNIDLTSHPWYYSECESVSELENMDNYDICEEISNEISFELLRGSISEAQKTLGIESRYDLDFPGMTAKRQRDKIISRHNSLTKYLNPQALLDRKALALDYWSTCRTICRTEKSKTDSDRQSKRNNRFCHYLKSLSFLCKNESFDNLSNSLKPSGN